ncbi:LysM peptidoglycan-binding domain-containing protein [Paenibacillus guangzhouensis]|uniref:LysM peptidoglycan-binding domain-containing protein n=1 Tax=Paenibacillus guangzhouensis TaxID=1473112 RepID=UPI001266D730|nr:LysM peptidoglycan-binding domain-containing protein [Paenibacillus guangzhouensis]
MYRVPYQPYYVQPVPQLYSYPYPCPYPYPVAPTFYHPYMSTPEDMRWSNKKATKPADCWNRAEVELNNLWRLVWEQHGAWTRMAIMSIAAGTPDETATVNRLLRNPGDTAAVLEPYYGEAAANRFKQLLTDHFELAVDLVKAAKAGEATKAADIEAKWYKNADEIAAFLSSINPYWNEAAFRKMLHDHLGFVKDEAVQQLNQQYEQSIATYDKMEQQILDMADHFTRGMTQQFPAKFGC